MLLSPFLAKISRKRKKLKLLKLRQTEIELEEQIKYFKEIDELLNILDTESNSMDWLGNNDDTCKWDGPTQSNSVGCSEDTSQPDVSIFHSVSSHLVILFGTMSH